MAQIIKEFDLDAFKKGDERSFRLIFDHFYGPLFAKSSKWVGNDEDIKDILQNTFFKIWEKREKYDSISHIRSALFLYTRNNIIKRWKKLHGKGGAVAFPDSLIEDFEPTGDPFDPFREERKWKIVQELFNRKMISMTTDETLSEQRRKVIHLHWVESKTVNEISGLLNIETPTVYTHIRQARLAAIQLLKKQIPDHLLTILWILITFFEKI